MPQISIRIPNCILIDENNIEHSINLLEIEHIQDHEEIDFRYIVTTANYYIFTYIEDGSHIRHIAHRFTYTEGDPPRIEIYRGRIDLHRGGDRSIVSRPASYQPYRLSPDETHGMTLSELLDRIDTELEGES